MLITTEQHARDATWLAVQPLDEINAVASELDEALADMRAEISRLHEIEKTDPGYAPQFPCWERYLETPAAIAASQKLARWQELPIGSSTYTATDFVRRKPHGAKQKYPLTQWRSLVKKIRRWIAS